MNRVYLIGRLMKPSVNVKYNSTYVKINDDEQSVYRRIVMCNEKQRNSLGLDMIRSIRSGVDTIDFDRCRVLIISSNQPKIFSAGHNLKEFTAQNGAQLHRNVFEEFTELCLHLKNLPIPVIAEVQGLAAAAGCQLAASCDMILASNSASFSTPGVKFGVFCSTPGVALSRNISPKIAAKMLFTGEAISSDEALRYGLVSEIVQSDKLEQRVNQLANVIATNSRFIVALGKQTLYKQLDEPKLNDAYKIATEAMVDNLKFEDTQSGLNAFISKRKPVWSNSPNKIEC